MARKAVGFDIRVLGDKRLQKKLNALEPKVQRKLLGKAMRAAMKPVLSQARQNAPHGSSLLGRKIRLRKAKVKSKHGQAFLVRTPTRAEAGIPKHWTGYWPAAWEYGFTHKGGKVFPAMPYMRPALEGNRSRILRKMRVELARFVRGHMKGGGK